MTGEGNTTGNRRLPQWQETWLIEHCTAHQLLSSENRANANSETVICHFMTTSHK